MDNDTFYDLVVGRILALPAARQPAEIARIVRRAAAGRPRAWRLAGLGARAVGRFEDVAITASAALACAQIGIVLVDDLLDDDPRGEQHQLGVGGTANLAQAFAALAGQVLLDDAELGRRPADQLRALATFQRLSVETARGQWLDSGPVPDEDTYWRVVAAKSAGFFGATLRLGAECAGAGVGICARLDGFGQLYGIILQIHDDLADSLCEPAGPDWLQGRAPLPVLFACQVDHPERERFRALRAGLCGGGPRPEPDLDLRQAQAMLWRSGAISYGLHQILAHHNQAQTELEALALLDPSPLSELLAEAVAPVWALLTAVESPPA